MWKQSDIRRTIVCLAEARGWSISYAARVSTGSGDTVARLDGGMSLTIRRAERIMARCAELWPADVEWPADIPRPAPREDAA